VQYLFKIISLSALSLWLAVPAMAIDNQTISHWQLLDEELHIYRYDKDNLDWRQIREERALSQTVRNGPKHLELRFGTIPDPFSPMVNGSGPTPPAKRILIRDPDGGTRQVVPTDQPQQYTVTIPDDLDLNGRYLLGGHVLAGHHDVNGDGRREQVHVYAKAMVGHYRNNGRPGSSPAFFFHDSDEMALEIGPALSPAQHRLGGGYQRPHQEYVMQVLYRNQPLAGATVRVTAEGSGWSKNFVTDAAGQFSVVPFDDRSGRRHWEKYLYTVTHLDQERASFHIATLPIIIHRNRPEWTNRLAGYAFWVLIGTTGSLMLVGFAVLRNRRQHKQELVVFDQYNVKGE